MIQMINFNRVRVLAAMAVASAAAIFMQGCNDAQSGALLGGGGGALLGQAIDHSTTGTVLGGLAGAGLGYIIGNESDKDRLRRYDERDRYYGDRDRGGYYYSDRYDPYYNHRHYYRDRCDRFYDY